VIKSQGSNNRTTSTLDLGIEGLPNDIKSQVRRDVGEFLVEQILQNVSQAKSPIQGESFPTLSASYKKRKKAEGGTVSANMELNGDMLDSLTFKASEDRNGIEIGFFDAQAAKADGHNNFSGRSKLPHRQFLPEEGDSFKASIQAEAEKIIADAMLEKADVKKSDLKGIQSSSELFRTLKELTGLSTNSQIRGAVTRNNSLAGILDDLDLLGLL